MSHQGVLLSILELCGPHVCSGVPHTFSFHRPLTWPLMLLYLSHAHRPLTWLWCTHLFRVPQLAWLLMHDACTPHVTGTGLDPASQDHSRASHTSHMPLLLSLELGRMRGPGDFDLPRKDPGPPTVVLYTWHFMPPRKSIPKCKQKPLLIKSNFSTKKGEKNPLDSVKVLMGIWGNYQGVCLPHPSLNFLIHYLLCGYLGGGG